MTAPMRAFMVSIRRPGESAFHFEAMGRSSGDLWTAHVDLAGADGRCEVQPLDKYLTRLRSHRQASERQVRALRIPHGEEGPTRCPACEGKGIVVQLAQDCERDCPQCEGSCYVDEAGTPVVLEDEKA